MGGFFTEEAQRLCEALLVVFKAGMALAGLLVLMVLLQEKVFPYTRFWVGFLCPWPCPAVAGDPTKQENLQQGRKGWNASGMIAMPAHGELEVAIERKPPKSQGENGEVTNPRSA